MERRNKYRVGEVYKKDFKKTNYDFIKPRGPWRTVVLIMLEIVVWVAVVGAFLYFSTVNCS